jgi:DNA-binding response OmpR family regulator
MLTLTSAQPQAMALHARPTRLLVIGAGEPHGRRTTGLLEPRGYEVERVRTLAEAGDLLGFEVVVFKPRPSEAEAIVELCRELRTEAASPAVVVLNPDEDAGLAIRLLEAGADDCLPAPHNPHEVLARIRALVRRRERNRGRYCGRHVVFNGLSLDARARRVDAPDGRFVELTDSQYRLLCALLSRPGRVVTREELLDEVLGEETDSFDRAIDVHVSRLKKRLAQVTEAELINCYRGVGYRIEVSRVVQ